ncbi:MAG: DUF4783 domain-containing protein [Lentimicrobiaceae bacterium]|nr:DUF4783 domain-containing protein [Lentimicrobiaceae bacterium]MCL2132463.1 DUF4783 domain-containing protein [Lentimicrobiaceae bacterium]
MIQSKISLFLCVLFSAVLLTTLSDEMCNDVNKGIQNGNAQQIAKYFSTTVELSVLGKDAYVGKTQATSILTDFFKENPPKSYAVKQGGSNSENTKFVIGTYVSTTGNTFKIYYVVKKEKSIETIQKLTIEKK